MAIEKQETTHHESQIRLSKKRSTQNNDELCFIVSPTIKSMGSPCSSTDVIIIDDEEITLEPKKKKQRLGSWWNYVEVIDELSCVVKGSSKAKDNNDAVSIIESCFSSTHLHEKKKGDKRSSSSLSSSDHHDNFIDLSEDEIVGESTCSSNSNKGNRHVTLEELGVTVEDLKSMAWEVFDPIWEIRSETMDPWLGGYVKDIISPDHYNSHA